MFAKACLVSIPIRESSNVLPFALLERTGI
jgi:hypothetical protein